ncbi:MAG: hemerythrin family protein [Candidatus Omnitrophica bacterium]|nr:hemerythrin family protein [Candidatus Omnitrophota bacterium]
MKKNPVAWNKLYSVNNEVLDDHHKQLFEYLRILEDEEYRELTSREFLDQIVDKLAEYADTHFTAEEQIMRKYEYPFIEQHLEEHKEFRHDVEVFKAEFDKDRPVLVNAMTHYLKNWLIRHILGTDKQYATYFSNKGIQTE